MAFGDKIVSRSTVYNQFKKFSEGDYSIKEEERSGRPVKLRDDHLLEFISN